MHPLLEERDENEENQADAAGDKENLEVDIAVDAHRLGWRRKLTFSVLDGRELGDLSGELLRERGDWEEAEALELRALELGESVLGANHPDVLSLKAQRSARTRS